MATGMNVHESSPAASRQEKSRASLLRAVIPALVLIISTITPVRAQVADDTTGLGGDYGTMRMLLEKTLFKVDVLELEIRLDPSTASKIAGVAGSGLSGSGASDSIARFAIDAADVWARLTFQRDVGVDRLIQEIRNSMRKAVDAGMLDQTGFDAISAGLPAWYASLVDRGIRDGDVQYYRIHGDTLRTMFIGRDGATWIDETATSPVNRRALLASWFAPGSDFRDGLIGSLRSR
jgi:hypothetical protein